MTRPLPNLRLMLAGLLALAALAIAAPAGRAATPRCGTTYTGSGGDWWTTADWSNGVPNATTVACIPAWAGASPRLITVEGQPSAAGLVIGAQNHVEINSTIDNGAARLTVGAAGITNSGILGLGEVFRAHPEIYVDPSAIVHNLSGGEIRLAYWFASIYGHVVNDAGATIADTTPSGEIDRLRNNGVVEIDPLCSLRMAVLENLVPTTGGQILRGGSFILGGDLSIDNVSVVANASTLTLAGGTVRDLAGTNELALASNAAAGVLEIGAPLGLAQAFRNDGQVAVRADGFAPAGYVQHGGETRLSGGTIASTVQVQGGVLSGVGTIAGDVVATNGTIVPAPGAGSGFQLHVTGRYQQTPGATLQVGGDQGDLAVDGPVDLGGTLAIDGAPNAPGDVRAGVISSGSQIVGNPLVRQLQPRSDGLTYVPVYSASQVDLQAVEETPVSSPSVAYDGWLGLTGLFTSGGGYREASGPGDVASFSFSGTSVTWLTVDGPFFGRARVKIDGVDKGVFDLYAAAYASDAKTFGGLADRRHTITITAVGSKSPAAQASFVVVDAFQAAGVTVEENDPAVSYDGWLGQRNAFAPDGGQRVATRAGARLTAGASGTQVGFVAQTGPSGGIAQIVVDGTVRRTVDLYAPTVRDGVLEGVTVPAGDHTVQVVATGTKSAASHGTRVVVQAIEGSGD